MPPKKKAEAPAVVSEPTTPSSPPVPLAEKTYKYLLVDTSESMGKLDRLAKAKVELKKNIYESGENCQVALYSFKKKLYAESELTPDKKSLTEKIEELKASGQTLIQNALVTLFGKIGSDLEKESFAPVAFTILTDAQDAVDLDTLKERLRSLQASFRDRNIILTTSAVLIKPGVGGCAEDLKKLLGPDQVTETCDEKVECVLAQTRKKDKLVQTQALNLTQNMKSANAEFEDFKWKPLKAKEVIEKSKLRYHKSAKSYREAIAKSFRSRIETLGEKLNHQPQNEKQITERKELIKECENIDGELKRQKTTEEQIKGELEENQGEIEALDASMQQNETAVTKHKNFFEEKALSNWNDAWKEPIGRTTAAGYALIANVTKPQKMPNPKMPISFEESLSDWRQKAEKQLEEIERQRSDLRKEVQNIKKELKKLADATTPFEKQVKEYRKLLEGFKSLCKTESNTQRSKLHKKNHS